MFFFNSFIRFLLPPLFHAIDTHGKKLLTFCGCGLWLPRGHPQMYQSFQVLSKYFWISNRHRPSLCSIELASPRLFWMKHFYSLSQQEEDDVSCRMSHSPAARKSSMAMQTQTKTWAQMRPQSSFISNKLAITKAMLSLGHGLTQSCQSAMILSSSDQFPSLLSEAVAVPTNEVDN